MGVALLVRAGTEGRSNAIRPASHEAGYGEPCAAESQFSFARDELVEIQQHACDVRPGGEFGASFCAEAGGQRQISGGQQRARRLRIGAIEPEVFVEQTGRRAHFLGARRAL